MGIENHPFRFMIGIAVSLLGSFWLLTVFAFASLVDPRLHGLGWWRAVLSNRAMYGPGLLGLTILASGVLLVGSAWTRPATLARPLTSTIRFWMLAIAIVALLLASYALTPGPTVIQKGGPLPLHDHGAPR